MGLRRLLIVTFVASFGALWAARARATEITVTGVSCAPAQDDRFVDVTFELAWRNAWRDELNHDAAWIAVKLSPRGAGRVLWRAAPIVEARAEGDRAAQCLISEERAGVFVEPGEGEAFRGDVAFRVTLTVAKPGGPAPEGYDALVTPIEMVYIPAGGYFAGDPDPAARNFGAIFRHAEDGGVERVFRIEDEREIAVGTAPGEMDYAVQNERFPYEGDRQGPIPEAFPKGTRAFYIMKYEIRQGQYAGFLSALRPGAANHRAISACADYDALRGTIRREGAGYAADDPQRPCNFLSWDDGCAWLDWAALRPMTELEFTKACRGSEEPGPSSFPWGSSSRDAVRRGYDDATGRQLGAAAGDESLGRDRLRAELGASYFGVYDLSGSLWEKCVTFGHPAGRAFTGAHGDGEISAYAFANNTPGWPAGDWSGGFGYRGGGFYEPGHTPGEFVPFSPTEYRRYGSWWEAPRTVAYGMRGVRSAPIQSGD